VTYRSGIPVLETEVKGSWSKTLRIAHGESFFLSATKTTAIGKVTTEVIIDGKSVDRQESILPWGTVYTEGFVPKP